MDSTQTLLSPPAPAKRRGPLARVCYSCLAVIGSIVFGLAISASLSNALKPPTFRPRPTAVLTRDPWINAWSTKLSEAYALDKASADKQYKGRVAHIGGRVTSIGKDHLGQTYVVLEGDAAETTGVRCFLTAAAAVYAAHLRLGQTVFVEGQVQGEAGQVLVKNCRFFLDRPSR